jgi:3-hydroxyisobutyryl-CoA hydrolase
LGQPSIVSKTPFPFLYFSSCSSLLPLQVLPLFVTIAMLNLVRQTLCQHTQRTAAAVVQQSVPCHRSILSAATTATATATAAATATATATTTATCTTTTTRSIMMRFMSSKVVKNKGMHFVDTTHQKRERNTLFGVTEYHDWEELESKRPKHEPETWSVASGTARHIILDRPKALNALTLNMVDQIQPQLNAWEESSNVNCVLVRGSGGRAFCAGGDVVALYHAGKQGGDTSSFFRREYELNYTISQLTKPYVALLNGVTMGGGVGLSVHGSHRVAMEETVFAMPETGIGFFPDVGGSYFLPRLHGELGMYLALTGARLKGSDVYHAGIATHFSISALLPDIHMNISELPRGSKRVIEAIGNLHFENELKPFSLGPHMQTINRCFGQDSVEQIVEALEAENTPFANQVLATLSKLSPTSLKVTFRQIREGANKSLEECFQMEYRISQGFMRPGSDFFEGLRALLIDKDRNPQWSAASLSEVTDEQVDEFFQPRDDDLNLGHLNVLTPEEAEANRVEAYLVPDDEYPEFYKKKYVDGHDVEVPEHPWSRKLRKPSNEAAESQQ